METIQRMVPPKALPRVPRYYTCEHIPSPFAKADFEIDNRSLPPIRLEQQRDARYTKSVMSSDGFRSEECERAR
jgi:hypothetical protein